MLATYGCGVLAVVSLLGMTRGWPFPFVRGEEAEKDNPPVPVSAEHGIQLREEAKQWADCFGRFLQPDWAVRPLELEPLDSDEGLIALRRHFPELNSVYSRWRPMNASLRGVPTTLFWMAGRSGNRPTTPEGMALLSDHNDLLRAMVAELTKIQGQTSISGACDRCKKSGSS
jgi:hypothetical protein